VARQKSSKKKPEKTEEFVDFVVRQLSPAPAQTMAVFFDPDEDDWCYFPVVTFAVGVVNLMRNGDIVDTTEGMVRGMISNHGGLELVEDTDDMEFIGYWRRDAQPEFTEFLGDHGIEQSPDGDDEAEDVDNVRPLRPDEDG
jgi:hypothetical protein